MCPAIRANMILIKTHMNNVIKFYTLSIIFYYTILLFLSEDKNLPGYKTFAMPK